MIESTVFSDDCCGQRAFEARFLYWERLMEVKRIGITRRYSDVVVHNGAVYLVEVPPNPEASITDQTMAMLDSVVGLLHQAGSDKSCLLMVTLYLADMADYEAVNAVWDDWLPKACAPVRACVQAVLANPKYRIEIALTAAVK